MTTSAHAPHLHASSLLVSRLQRRISVLYQHLHIRIEPSSGRRRALKPAPPVALTTRLDPHNTVDKRIIRLGSRQGSKPTRSNVAPSAPLLPSTRQRNTALVNDELGGQTFSLEERCQRSRIVRLVPRGGPLGVVLANLGVERVVVAHVGCVAADLGLGVALLGQRDDAGKD